MDDLVRLAIQAGLLETGFTGSNIEIFQRMKYNVQIKLKTDIEQVSAKDFTEIKDKVVETIEHKVSKTDQPKAMGTVILNRTYWYAKWLQYFYPALTETFVLTMSAAGTLCFVMPATITGVSAIPLVILMYLTTISWDNIPTMIMTALNSYWAFHSFGVSTLKSIWDWLFNYERLSDAANFSEQTYTFIKFAGNTTIGRVTIVPIITIGTIGLFSTLFPNYAVWGYITTLTKINIHSTFAESTILSVLRYTVAPFQLVRLIGSWIENERNDKSCNKYFLKQSDKKKTLEQLTVIDKTEISSEKNQKLKSFFKQKYKKNIGKHGAYWTGTVSNLWNKTSSYMYKDFSFDTCKREKKWNDKLCETCTISDDDVKEMKQELLKYCQS